MKLIAYYLPQFHNIPENDEWWGDGFTEWTNIKKSKSYFVGHKQPRKPLNDNFYDLLDDDVKIWQADLAKRYGIYGFCYYHYWFNGKMLLEKPMEQMLKNKKIDIPFCICWANEAWTKQWVGNERTVLIRQYYGNEREWREHFEYLVQFFNDERYIYKDGCPLISIYKPNLIPCLDNMISFWKKIAPEYGLQGITIVGAWNHLDQEISKGLDYFTEWPHNIAFELIRKQNTQEVKKASKMGIVYNKIWKKINEIAGCNLQSNYDIVAKIKSKIRRLKNKSNNEKKEVIKYDYCEVWDEIIKLRLNINNRIPSALVRWDNTPRYNERGVVTVGDTPMLYEHCLEQQIMQTKNEYKEDYMFMFAWNEWTEGAMLEPDNIDGYGFLEATKKALENTNEFPKDFKGH